MKKIIAALMIVLLLISFVGCKKLVDTEYKTVEVEIIDTYWHCQWVQPIRIGKANSVFIHPEKNEVTVEYNGITRTFDNKELYNKYHNKVSEFTTATLEIKTYDNGDIEYRIFELH